MASDTEAALPLQDLDSHHEQEEDYESLENSDDKDDFPPSNQKKDAGSLEQTKSNASIADTLSPIREFLFVAVICAGQFCTQAGLGQTLSILHVIGDHYGITNPGDLSWLIAGYSLTIGTFILVCGRLGDLFGYKRMLIIGYTWFSLWSMIAGLAVYSNQVLFIFARVLSGLGPSMILTNGLALLGASYAPGPRKSMVFALFGAMAPIGSVVGSTFGALFSLAWWPWTFWSFSLGLALLDIIALWAVPSPPSKAANESLRSKMRDLDIPGGLLGVTALILFNFAWNQAGAVGWQEPYVYVCLILGLALVPAFFWVELRYAPAPLIPFSSLSSDVSFVLACVACGWACFGIWVYYIWQFLEVLRGVSPLLGSAMVSPVTVSGAMASITTGILLQKLRPAWVMTLALTCFTVGTILIATTPVDQTYWAQTFVCTVVIPWGMDMSFPAATLILSNAVPKEDQGIGASLVNTVVNYSISLGLGFAGTVESHVNNGGLTKADTLKGYRGALYTGIGLSGMGLVISLVFLAKSYITDSRKT